ncbi:class IV adenylate cyclase [Methanogenium organophilum]|uniref:Class IV adenylate cyclase n=1 Tax=Methanogenium organophilum TaxID=2199 RepID=A0A9X9S3T2_METOG|nr:class IV adenylate cyclase [Methanogenium organophilum]WAI01026.1 class IV adenylate cyclase [Methanogenium organophilum]
MSSVIEVETKIAVPNIPEIAERLRSLGASYLGGSFQRDTYLNAPHCDYAETDEALRVRETNAGVEITYKGPKQQKSGAKARTEITVSVASAEDAIRLLTATGFNASAIVKKEREEYTYGGTTIALDHVEGLGTYVEIEVLTEKDVSAANTTIESVKKELNISGDHIPESYLELLLMKE